ncbi:MAG: parallel beta-helix repeat protein [Flammeovirgaceae bacterium]|jgi:parallel beta-helix repeat protein
MFLDAERSAYSSNIITGNSISGISLADGSSENILIQNLIYNNANGFRGIVFENSAVNGGIEPPTIENYDDSESFIVSGTGTVGAIIEVFADSLGEGRGFLGSAVVVDISGAGEWIFNVPSIFQDTLSSLSIQTLTAIQTIDNEGSVNTSEFSEPYIINPTLVRNVAPATQTGYPIGSLGYAIDYANTNLNSTITFHPCN